MLVQRESIYLTRADLMVYGAKKPKALLQDLIESYRRAALHQV